MSLIASTMEKYGSYSVGVMLHAMHSHPFKVIALSSDS